MNESLFLYLNGLAGQSNFFDTVLVFTSDGFGVFLLVGLIVFLLSHEHKGKGLRDVFVILVSAVLAWGLSKLIKLTFYSPRPFLELDDVTKLIDHGNIDSFTSGHATFFSAIGVSLFYYHKWLGG